MDYGMFVQNVMLADNETLVCGMALGFANPEAPENALKT
jgi:hypothetical protein